MHHHDPNDNLSVPKFLCRICNPDMNTVPYQCVVTSTPATLPPIKRQDPEVVAFLQEQEERRKLKATNARIAAAAKVDTVGKRWDTRLVRWVPDGPKCKEDVIVSVEQPAKPPKEPIKKKSNGEIKHEILMELLTRPEGATLAEISEKTGWLGHTAGARISGIKTTYEVIRIREIQRGTVYRANKK